jgi:4-amino-4-deoxy-L-arabinose transferase-like glycosyltransferase
LLKRESAIPLLVLIAIIAGGTYVRFANLGRSDLRGDEVYHYLAAKSLQRGEGPVLPHGGSYTRGIEFSRLVAVSDRIFGDRELAARMPSAVLGVINLILFAVIAWAIAGPWAAVWAVLLLAIYPEAVSWSRRARFYTYQLNLGLAALFAGWRALRCMGSEEVVSGSRVLWDWIWMGLAALFLLLGARVQLATLSVGLGFASCVAIAAAMNVRRHGWRSWRRNVPLQATALGLISVVGLLVAFPDLVGRLMGFAFSVPLWVQVSESPLFYYYALAEVFPLVISASPVIFLAVWLRNFRLATFLFLWFAVPFLAHSLLFPFKGARFILAATPALFLATGIAAAMGFAWLRRVVAAEAGRLGSGPALQAVAARVAVALVALFVVLTTPALDWTRKVPGQRGNAATRERWGVAGEIIQRVDPTGSVPVGSLDRLAPYMYFGRLDFYAGRVGHSIPGVPQLSTAEAIRGHFQGEGSVLIAVDSARLRYGLIEPSLANLLAGEGRELCDGQCGSLMVYRWDFGGE